MKKVEFKRPDELGENHFLKDIFEVVNAVDKENWSYFGMEEIKDFCLNFLNYGELTRLIYVENEPVGYVDCYVLKQNAPVLLKDDFYHTVGLSSKELRTGYLGKDVNSSDCHLYVNVVAVKREHHGNVRVVKKIAGAVEDILEYNFNNNNRPEKIYAVTVSDYGERMCEFFKFVKISVTTRMYDQNINNRILYTGDSSELLRRLKKISGRNC